MIRKEAFQGLVHQLTEQYGAGEANAISRIALEDALGWRLPWGVTPVTTPEEQQLAEITQRLLRGEPVQYVTGRAEFLGLFLEVTPAVLIPRPETAELVLWALELLQGIKQPRILDVGTGSGCIPLAIKQRFPSAELWAVDVSVDALAVARKNANQENLPVTFLELDILQTEKWADLPVFDMLVSNPPYIPPQERSLMSAHVLDYEPSLALFVPNDDPLVFYRALGDLGQTHLQSGGKILVECNEYNALQVVDLFENQGYKGDVLRKDLSGKDRMVAVSKP